MQTGRKGTSEDVHYQLSAQPLGVGRRSLRPDRRGQVATHVDRFGHHGRASRRRPDPVVRNTDDGLCRWYHRVLRGSPDRDSCSLHARRPLERTSIPDPPRPSRRRLHRAPSRGHSWCRCTEGLDGARRPHPGTGRASRQFSSIRSLTSSVIPATKTISVEVDAAAIPKTRTHLRLESRSRLLHGRRWFAAGDETRHPVCPTTSSRRQRTIADPLSGRDPRVCPGTAADPWTRGCDFEGIAVTIELTRLGCLGRRQRNELCA